MGFRAVFTVIKWETAHEFVQSINNYVEMRNISCVLGVSEWAVDTRHSENDGTKIRRCPTENTGGVTAERNTGALRCST